MEEEVVSFSDSKYIALLTLIGNKWNIQVLDAIYHNEMIRFTQLHKKMETISQKMLSISLKTLEEHKLIKRVSFPEIPPRVEYSLTEKGRELILHLKQIWQWQYNH